LISISANFLNPDFKDGRVRAQRPMRNQAEMVKYAETSLWREQLTVASSFSIIDKTNEHSTLFSVWGDSGASLDGLVVVPVRCVWWP